MKNISKRIISIILGPVLFVLMILVLPAEFTIEMRGAIGTLLWMVCWWLFPPCAYPVIGFLPMAVNALLPMIDMSTVIAQYASTSIIMVLGGMIILASWTATGLDKRIATSFLYLVGTSARSQAIFWYLLAVILSSFLPNLVVAATIIPIAYSMLKYCGLENIRDSKAASLIMMVIPWGATVGGLTTPLGSASNIVIIGYIEQIIGREYFYTDWVIRFLPIMVTLVIINVLFIFAISPKDLKLPGSKEYLLQVRNDLGKMKKNEWISLLLFVIAAVFAFTRNLYADLIPGLQPAYAFVICAILLFLIPGEGGKPIAEWKEITPEVNWGLLYMFGGALALGELLTGTGADIVIGNILSNSAVHGEFFVILIVLAFTLTISDLTSNGATAAMCMPIILTMATALNMNPIPLIYVGSIGVSLSYTLPTSIRAISVGYGLEPSFLVKRGFVLSLIVIPALSFLCFMLMKYWPAFLT